ncbi:GNAT family N-acetyltransferase [Pseudanabaena sp. PCC 6802]|uniref:GNAT family N-acetyltransferase n=1 Tax=Pseudanabaena sp. PCC 6802 TaxID=118173 RepID=UPI00034B1283|nr:GNAT family N-acetyltransferase [Pseudanabaena sp. PCC 6802]
MADKLSHQLSHQALSDRGVTFRDITPEDLPFLQRLYASTREEEMAMVDWSDRAKADFLQMQFEAQHKYYQANYAQTSFQIILLHEEPIGRLYVARWEQEIRIVDLAILPEHRDRGIGSQILQDLLAEATRRGLPLRIHVEQYNRALRLYQRLGFQKIGEHGVYWLMECTPGEVLL